MRTHDMPGIRSHRMFLCLPVLFALACPVPAGAQHLTIPPIPLNDSKVGPPLIMLIASKEHKQYTAAYDDTTDVDGDGIIDVGFKPYVAYYGLFDSNLCYEGRGRNVSATPYTGTTYAFSNTADFFEPVAPVTDDVDDKGRSLYKCGGGRWSGNFLNYVTTSSMDALRKVLYGGYRTVDTVKTTASSTTFDTIVRRVYIPRDGHAWGKEYTSVGKDKYNISDYTPFSLPKTDMRHFFGNYTWPGANCGTDIAGAERCRDKAAPLLHVALNVPNGKRIWDWADTDVTKLFDDANVGAEQTRHYIVQARVCSNPIEISDDIKDYRGDNCKLYTDSRGRSVYKPAGVLQKFGEDGSVLFGLFTGSYDYNISGAELRRRAQNFSDELSADGNFKYGATSSVLGISYLLNRMMIRGYGYSRAPEYRNLDSTNTSTGSGPRLGHRVMKDGEFVDWGNPIGEAMFETLRYLSGTGKPTPEFTKASTIDIQLLPTLPAWDSPYGKNPIANDYVPWCSKPNILVLSDTNTSFDSDQVTGASFKSCTNTDKKTRLTASAECTRVGNDFKNTFDQFNAKALLDDISTNEGIGGGKKYFIGQSGNNVDWAPTAKTVSSLATIRGLPEDPGKEGSYTAAAAARYGKQVGIVTVKGKERVSVDTWIVALASPLPEIKANGITIVPFGKSIAGGGLMFNVGGSYGNGKGYFQPNNQIVKFYVRSMSKPGEPYDATFLISFDDVEQGGSYSMGFLAEYRVKQVGNDVEVTVTPKAFATDVTMNVGYVISGAGDQDGPYLVVQNRSQAFDGKTTLSANPAYYFNVPDGERVGYCDSETPGSNPDDPRCTVLPACTNGNSMSGECHLLSGFDLQHSKRTFTPSGSAAAEVLPNPLWLAAKYGSFRTKLGESPKETDQWDFNKDGVPDNYFPARNAAQLEGQLVSAINNIRESSGQSSGRISSGSDILVSGDNLIFSTTFNFKADPPDWSGNLIATRITSMMGTLATQLGSPIWHAASELQSHDKRRIFTNNNASIVEFKWDNLHPDQQSALGALGDYGGEDVLNYVRGSNTKEIKYETGNDCGGKLLHKSGSFRCRTRMGNAPSPLGDSLNNTPYFFKPTNTIYLGANDGMLHAYNVKDGNELFAYIPSALIPKLPELASPAYIHNWYVDGEVAIGTIGEDSSSEHWLVGGLGRGGYGLFGLNVTDPAKISSGETSLAGWELKGTPWGKCINKDAKLDNLGIIIGAPVIGKFNDGGTYAVVGNGYNSCGTKTGTTASNVSRAFLYVINIKTGDVVAQIPTNTLSSNGLSTPVAVDIDGNGTIDLIYAGDLRGELWRFDMRSSNPNDWKARLGGLIPSQIRNGTSLFNAGISKPISAPPAVILDSEGVPWVIFGTGSFLTAADKTSSQAHSWYGLKDNTDGSATQIANTNTALTQRKFESAKGKGMLPSGEEIETRHIQKQTANDMNNKRGWYVNFESGERVITSPVIVITPRGTVVEVTSIIPDNDPCNGGGYGYLNFVDAFTGAGIEFAFIDLNGDGIVNDKDLRSPPASSMRLQNGLPGNVIVVDGQNVIGGTDGDHDVIKLISKGGGHRGRISWQEIIRQ